MAKGKAKTNESIEKKSVRRPAKPTAQRPVDRFGDFKAQSLQRVIVNPALATPADILALGRRFSNRAVQRLLARRQRGREGFQLDDETSGRINRARGSGQPLTKGLQEQMGACMGHDFSRVQIHTCPESDELNRRLSARAFTSGRDIFFRRGEYNPGSANGRELIAHELTHVVQQDTGRIPGGSNGIAVRPAGDPFEREAEDEGRRAARSVRRAKAESDCKPATAKGSDPITSFMNGESKLDGVIQRYALSGPKSALGIKEREWAVVDLVEDSGELVFTKFTSCIGIVGRKGDRIVGVHLSMYDENDEKPPVRLAADLKKAVGKQRVVFGYVRTWEQKDACQDFMKSLTDGAELYINDNDCIYTATYSNGSFHLSQQF